MATLTAILKTATGHFQAALSWTLTIVTLSLCALTARIAMAPLSLDGFAPIVERQAAARLESAGPGWRLSVGGVKLAWEGAERGLGVRLTELILREPAGGIAFQAPALTVELDPAAALAGEVAPRGLSLFGAEAVIARDDEGRWRFALAGPVSDAARDRAEAAAPQASTALKRSVEAAAAEAAESGLQNTARLIEAWSVDGAAQGALGPLSLLRRVSVLEAGVTYLDDLSGAVWRAKNARLELTRPEGGGLSLALQASLALDDQGGEAKFSVLGRRPADVSEATVNLRFENAPAAALAAQFPDLDALRAIEGYMSGEAEAAISLESGDLLNFTASLRGEGAQFAALRRGAAVARPQSGANHITGLSAFDASFDYAPKEDLLTLRRLEVVGDRLEASLEGTARFLRTADGAAYGATGALSIISAVVHDKELFEDPVRIDAGGFDYRLEGGAPGSAAPPRLTLTGLHLNTEDLHAEGSARILFAPPEGPALADSFGAAVGARADVDLTLSDFEATRLPAFWPQRAAPGGRVWALENLKEGWIRNGVVQARIGGGAGFEDYSDAAPGPASELPTAVAAAKETIDFKFQFDGLKSLFAPLMSPVSGGAGEGHVSADRFDLRLETGEVDLGEHGVITLDGSSFAITSFLPDPPPAEVHVKSESSVRAVLALLDEKPLAPIRERGLTPEDAEGTVEAETFLTLPLAKNLLAKEVGIQSEGRLSDLALPLEPLDGAVASAESAIIKVSDAGLSLEGDVRLDRYEGLLFKTVWRETFAPEPGAPSTRVTADTEITAARLEAFGVPAEMALEGSMGLSLRVESGKDAPASLRATADLRQLGATLPWLQWWKTPGEPGRIEAIGAAEGGVWSLPKLAVTAPRFMARGAATLNAAGGLTSLSFSPLRLETGTEMNVTLNFASDGGVGVSGGGPRLQIGAAREARRPGVDAIIAQKKAAPNAAEPRLSVSLRFDRVLFGPEASGLTQAQFALSRSPQGGLYADISARAGDAVLNGSARPARGDKPARYRAETDNLGAVLTSLGLVEKAEKGAATLVARETQTGRIDGVLRAKGLVIKSAPAVADVLSVASVVGIMDLASSGGITFTSIEAPFFLDEKRLVVNELAASGPSMGMTAKGLYDLRTAQVDARGSVSPAFVLNGLPSQVPVLGEILTGGEGHGVVGFTFSVKGPAEDPKVRVDPLSAVMPGPLRKLFGG